MAGLKFPESSNSPINKTVKNYDRRTAPLSPVQKWVNSYFVRPLGKSVCQNEGHNQIGCVLDICGSYAESPIVSTTRRNLVGSRLKSKNAQIFVTCKPLISFSVKACCNILRQQNEGYYNSG